MTVTKANLGQVILAERNGHVSEVTVRRFSKSGNYVCLAAKWAEHEWVDPDSVKVVEVLEEAKPESAPQEQQQQQQQQTRGPASNPLVPPPVVLPDPVKDQAPTAPATTGGSPGSATLQQPTLT